MHKAILLIVILTGFWNLSFPAAAAEASLIKADSPDELCEILFIGSSYFGSNDLPGLYSRLALSARKYVYIDSNCPSGVYLSDHAKSAVTEAKINERDWDFIILQGVGRLMAYPQRYDDHPVYDALLKLQEKIANNCPDTRMIFCLPWAYEDGMLWAGWPDDYEDMQMKIKNYTLDCADELDFVIAPVGWAWYEVLKELDYPLHYLHQSDWNHPSLKGSYLMACVIHSTIFQESTEGLDYTAGLADKDAAYFQSAGSRAVLDTPEQWHIIPLHTDPIHPPGPEAFSISQNYPNPACSYTDIRISIKHPGVLEYSIIDQMGRPMSASRSEIAQPGKYSMRLDCSNFPHGIYYFIAKQNRKTQIQKMLILAKPHE